MADRMRVTSDITAECNRNRPAWQSTRRPDHENSRRVGRGPFSAPDGAKRERVDRSPDNRLMAKTPRKDCSAIEWRDIVPDAQSERRGGAGPVGGLLGGKDPPAASIDGR